MNHSLLSLVTILNCLIASNFLFAQSDSLILSIDTTAFVFPSELPTNKLYNDSGHLKEVVYGDGIRYRITYFESGRVKSETASGSDRHWYENGQVKSQSITSFKHQSIITSWYENGQIKEYGHRYWKHNQELNHGEWIDSGVWKRWDEKGILHEHKN